MWDLPRPGLEPVSPALAGRFSTTAPPGKPLEIFLLLIFSLIPLWLEDTSVWFKVFAIHGNFMAQYIINFYKFSVCSWKNICPVVSNMYQNVSNICLPVLSVAEIFVLKISHDIKVEKTHKSRWKRIFWDLKKFNQVQLICFPDAFLF